MSKLDPDSLDRHFFTMMRASDYKNAARFFTEHTREALLAGDDEGAVHACHLLIASLIPAGLDREAIDLIWQVVRSFPEDIYLRFSFAGFLLSFGKQPAQALEALEPVYERLLAEEGSRHGALGLRGTILLELERVQEAENCFKEMLEPSLWRMYPAAFDLRLVESLISGGLMKKESEHYLEIVYKRAQEMDDDSVEERAGDLLRLLK